MAWTQIIALIGLSLIGGVMSMWMRRFGMQGLELWLPMSIIVAYGISPLAGLAVAVAMIAISFAMHPYELQNVVIIPICLAGIVFATKFLPVTAATFAERALWLAIGYNIASNAILVLMGIEFTKLIKFMMFSLFFCWLLFTKFGWQIVLWLKGG